MCDKKSFNFRQPNIPYMYQVTAGQPKIPSRYIINVGTFGADPSSTRHAESIYIHEKYNTTTFENDIAVIQVKFQQKIM